MTLLSLTTVFRKEILRMFILISFNRKLKVVSQQDYRDLMTPSLLYLESRRICGGARGVEGDVSHGAGLRHHEDLHGLRHLLPRHHRRVHQLEPLERKMLLIMD